MHTATPERILVIANETADAAALLEVIEHSAGEDAKVLVVAPALNSRLRPLGSPTRTPRARPREGAAPAQRRAPRRAPASTRPG